MPVSRAALTALAAALMLTGCSAFGEPPEPTRLTAPPEGAPTAPAATPSFTVADSRFAQLMIPHHAQAVEMADLVPQRTDNPELVTIAQEIKGAQQPEIDRMRAWLQEWGIETDPPEPAEQAGIEGMLDEDDLQALRDARGPQFDRLWLEGMIVHHAGAVAMAETLLSSGAHRPTRTLAEGIILARGAEIIRMRAMLGG